MQWQENIQLFTVVHHTDCSQLLVSSPVFSSLTRRRVDGLMFACWLRGRGWSLPTFTGYCDLIGRHEPLWPYSWGSQLSLDMIRGGWRDGEMLSVNAGRRGSRPSPFCYFSPSPNGWYCLFTLHLNGWASSPYFSASFDIRCSPNGSITHVQKIATTAQ